MTESSGGEYPSSRINGERSKNLQEVRNSSEEKLFSKFTKETLRTGVVPMIRDLLREDEEFQKLQKTAIELQIPENFHMSNRRIKLLYDPQPVELSNGKRLSVVTKEGEREQYRSKQILITFDEEHQPHVNYSTRVALTDRNHDYTPQSFGDDSDRIVPYDPNIPSVICWMPVLHDPEFQIFLEQEGTDGIENSLYDQLRFAKRHTTYRLDDRKMEWDGKKATLKGSSDKDFLSQRVSN